jgi:hypothetical protein
MRQVRSAACGGNRISRERQSSLAPRRDSYPGNPANRRSPPHLSGHTMSVARAFFESYYGQRGRGDTLARSRKRQPGMIV